MLTFHRGLAVPRASAEAVMDDIRTRGLHEYGRSYNLYHQPLAEPEVLFAKPDLTTVDTRGKHLPVEPAICACGEEEGAAHYAWHHNRHSENDTPVMVAFEAPLQDVVVDGRDFLYAAFQIGRPDRARDALARVFGSRVLRYAERAWDRKDRGYSAGVPVLGLPAEEVMLDGRLFDPAEHFSMWRVRDAEQRERRRREVPAALAAALAEVPEGRGRWKAVAGLLNEREVPTFGGGTTWTPDNVRTADKEADPEP
jgi:hypothetical protein